MKVSDFNDSFYSNERLLPIVSLLTIPNAGNSSSFCATLFPNSNSVSSSGASNFARWRVGNASDWWRWTRDHGKEKEERLLLPTFPCAHINFRGEREKDVWVRGRFRALLLNSKLKQRRRWRKRERRKSNWFTESSKTTSLYVHHAFWYISLPSLHEYDVKCLISRFVEDVTWLSFPFFWTFRESFWIQLQKNLPTFDELREME